MTIADRLKKVSSRIQQSLLKMDKSAIFDEKTTKTDFSIEFNGLNRFSHSVKLLAVSKTHPASAIQAGFDAGITEFAESYIQEAESKINQLNHLNVIWHFIGPIQSNKTRIIATLFDWVQSVDRLKIMQRINDQRPSNLPPINLCIQVNYFDEASKKGAKQSEVDELLEMAQKLPNIALRGMMFIPPKQDNYDEQLSQFLKLKKFYNQYQLKYPNLDTLSMGMSKDLEAAIAAGSTMIRVGTDIFGARNE